MPSEPSSADLQARLGWLAAEARPDWHVLEIGTGRVMELLRPHVAEAVSYELSGPGFSGLPFGDQRFDCILCIDSASFLYDAFPLIQTCARLLRRGGLLVIDEVIVPDDQRAARYVDAFERLRNPRHRRGYAEFEWHGLLLDAGLRIESSQQTASTIQLLDWAQPLNRPAAVVERLHILLALAPQAVAEWLQPRYANSPAAAFLRHRLQLTGRKAI